MSFIPSWEDTRLVRFDDTCVFGHGTCFDGFDYLRMESSSPIGRFAIWKELGPKNIWSAYGGDSGYLAWQSLQSEDEAKQWVIDLVNSSNS